MDIQMTTISEKPRYKGNWQSLLISDRFVSKLNYVKLQVSNEYFSKIATYMV